MDRINLKRIFYFLLLLCFFGCSSSKKETTPKKPNILFILSDDHTSQAWGIYGGPLKEYAQNKNISRLATEGAVLNNAFCTNSICVPSRATILTGQYSHKNGVYTLSDALNPDSLNIAKVLRNNGYQTAIIGKWHLKKEPSGFDYYNVLHDQGRYWDPILRTRENFHKPSEEWDVHKGFSTDVIADLSVDWLKERDTTKPFLLMTHFKATHEPFDYPERFNDLYKDQDLPEPESLYDFSPSTTGRSFVGQKLENLAWRYEQASNDPDKWWCKYPGLPFYTNEMDSIEARKATYQKFVKDFLRSGAAIDDNIGKLLDYLETSGQAENTVVIYTADQGYFLGEHGFFDKRLIYDESLRMPFVIRYPKEIHGGQRIDDIILNIDFPALFADYAGIEKPSSMQGKSFRENLKGNTPKDWRTAAYYRYWQHYPIRPGHFGVRNDKYKLAFFYGQSLDMTGSSKETSPPAWEFYDLTKDPKENHNAYNDPEYQGIIKTMKETLKQEREALGDTDENYPLMQDIFKEHWN
ncbi:sulfatase family protein [Snuella sedimenti]|uniref:Sulfatase n=1 Tax=Snuella sedimenti TaxID=2798802 RepID=A0A8J7LNF3_9FLAO|nr:sulfatase [Snuella sedimenti]MBJ6368724.1 sulfatase [Snuella sedimenti]